MKEGGREEGRGKEGRERDGELHLPVVEEELQLGVCCLPMSSAALVSDILWLTLSCGCVCLTAVAMLLLTFLTFGLTDG